MPHILVRKSYYDEGWSSVDNPYGPGGAWSDEPAIPKPEKRSRVTMDNSFQSTLPYHDWTLDRTTGWKGVEPISAIRYMGDYRAGSPVEQDEANVDFEHGGTMGMPPTTPIDTVDFDAPTVSAPHGELAPEGWKDRPPTDADADFGFPDNGGWLYRDPKGMHYYFKNGMKHFMDLNMGEMGSWWTKPNLDDFRYATGQSASPTKIVGIRGDPSDLGRISRRDSDEQPREGVAEMFLHHDKNIPRDRLVEIPLSRDKESDRLNPYIFTAKDAGLVERENWQTPSRWSNMEPLPWSKGFRKSEERPHGLMSNNDLFERINEILHYQSTDDNNDEYDELLQEAMKRRQENLPEPSFGALSEPPIPFDEDFQDAHKSEPMDIAFQLLKERKSPEAMRHKREYDKKYESSPERVKYREQLNRERRRRGIYGSGDHMDVSHTQGGKLTLEGEHANRARHFKNRGTLRRVRVR